MADQFPAVIPTPLTETVAMVEKALEPEDVEWLAKHLIEGAHGFPQFLGSARFKKLARAVYAEYREFLSCGS